MQNFAKSILNYFATYNETRFRFTTRVAQKWTNDELSLDFSVFPNFEKEIINQLSSQGKIDLRVNPKEYIVGLDSEDFSSRLNSLIEDLLSADKLKQIKTELEKKLPEDTELPTQEVWRKWALQLRKAFAGILHELQEEKKQSLVAENEIKYLPLSTLNVTAIEQELFDVIDKKIINQAKSDDDFISAVKIEMKSFNPELIMYDLYKLLQGYNQFIASNSVYLFLHDLTLDETSYPLVAVELQISNNNNSQFLLTSVRDLVQLNTPAINATKMGTVLTTPRACTFSDLTQYSMQFEMYLQAHYKHDITFILAHNFKPLVGKDLPTIYPRIGLQITTKEDRKILDYSELITKLESGAGKKFSDIVADYVDGNVESTVKQVHETFQSEYPKKSVRRLINEIPLHLNSNQQKILTAAKNEKNKTIVVDGPPGTGKSYTITALVYLANLLGKKILITSHKTQALDVVEEKLLEQFKSIHPHAKPPILRLTKNGEQTVNTIDNTLSSPVINATNNRASQVDTSVLEKDIEALEKDLSEQVELIWNEATASGQQQSAIEKLIEKHHVLFKDDPIPQRGSSVDMSTLKKVSNILSQAPAPISLDIFNLIATNQGQIEAWQEAVSHLDSESLKITDENELVDFSLLDSLDKKLQQFLQIFNEQTQLKSIDFSSLKNIQYKKQISSQQLDYDSSKKLLAKLEQWLQSSKGLGAKLFGNATIRELEHAVKIDYPEVYSFIQENGIEKTVFALRHDLEKVDEITNENQILNKNGLYINSFDAESLQKEWDNLSENELRELQKANDGFDKKLSEYSLNELTSWINDKKKFAQTHIWLDKILPLTELIKTDSIDQINSLLTFVSSNKEVFNQSHKELIAVFIEDYYQQLKDLNISINELNKLQNLFSDTDKAQQIFEYITLHQSIKPQSWEFLDTVGIQRYQQLAYRLLQKKNEARFAGLLDHIGDVQRILNTIATNKRLTVEQSNVLFEHIPCVIAPPEKVSHFFPMQEDMIDWLIIDEASQVSIAESLSLMLRAKQTIVFGDELQYGAVGATNVSLEYSKQYFRNVLDDYVKDKNDFISEEERERIATDESKNYESDEAPNRTPNFFQVNPATKEWLKTFSIRTSTLDFAKAVANYSDSLTVHFRSFPEIISYSNKYFYKPSEINLVTSRIRTKPISEVLQFIPVNTQGHAGGNINLDEIVTIKNELQKLYDSEFKGSVGVICSFREQTDRMIDILRKDLPCFTHLVEKNNLKIWFVGDVQGEERDIIFYSFVQDKRIDNANLSSIYPVIGGVADDIRNLRMQRLNVGFSRAKDKMVFVHSMDISEYKDTRLGDALGHYQELLSQAQDHFIADTAIFDSPAEERLYSLLTQTDFFSEHKDNLKVIAQFEIGKYIREEFKRFIPNYRVDFLLTLTRNGKEHPLIIEYDGLEFHTKRPYEVYSESTFSQEYLEYDIQRQLELESYGYKFLRINKFTLSPKEEGQTELEVLNQLLYTKYRDILYQ